MKTDTNEQKPYAMRQARQDEKECLKCCNFFNGEEESPYESRGIEYQNYNMFWFYEKCWCRMSDREREWNTEEYKAYGLADFRKDDGTPISLKALLFNRYCHWCGGYGNDAEGFKSWYIKDYCDLSFIEDIALGIQSKDAILQYMKDCPDLWGKVYDRMRQLEDENKAYNADKIRRLGEALLLMNEAEEHAAQDHQENLK